MIFGRHSVLKRGCSTWDQEQIPQAEFQSRLESLRREMARQNLDALVIYGDNYSFGDLCYLTNYFPKVRGGLCVVPREGAIALLLNIGSRDVPFAKSLTWVEDVRASNELGRAGAKLLEEKHLSDGDLGLVDCGKGLPLPQVEELKGSLRQARWRACHSLIEEMRLNKSVRELAALHAAGSMLREIAEGARGFIKPARKEYEVIADIDRLARDKGVEDIRVLAGERRLCPPGAKMTASIDKHWAVYLAVQHERYWAESGRTYILSNDAKLQGAYQKAQEILARMAAELRPGNPVGDIDQAARRELGEFYATASMYGLGNGIGLNQWEPPFLSEDDAREVGAAWAGATALRANMTLALRVAIDTEGKIVLFGDSFQVTADGAKWLAE